VKDVVYVFTGASKYSQYDAHSRSCRRCCCHCQDSGNGCSSK
jgi:hypothetical protein